MNNVKIQFTKIYLLKITIKQIIHKVKIILIKISIYLNFQKSEMHINKI